MATDPRLIAALREVFENNPNAEIATELVRLDHEIVVVKALIANVNGGKVSAHGSFHALGLDEPVEQAETKAIWRALALLGVPVTESSREYMPAPGFRETVRQAAEPAPETPDESDAPLEDISWTAFWKWARDSGFESKGAVEAMIGRSMQNLNPSEIRQLILAKRGS